MSKLKDIQKNTSEFNVSFHMKQVIAAAIITLFQNEEALESVKTMVKSKSDILSIEVSLMYMYQNFVNEYLHSEMGDEENEVKR